MSGDTNLFIGDYQTAAFTNIWMTRSPALRGDFCAAAIYQSVIKNLKWDLGKFNFRYLNELHEVSPEQLSIQFTVDRFNMTHDDPQFSLGRIIDGYHFLVSIAPETIESNLEIYTETINNSGIADYHHKGLLLEITFVDGSTYEYFGVTTQVYHKMINSDKLNRFAKRTIYPNYLYRKTKKSLEVV